MGLFGFGDKKKISALEQENRTLRQRNKQLVDLCEEKDSFFKELMSDGLKNGSSLAGKHMADRKEYLKKKK